MINGYSANVLQSTPDLSELQEGYPTNGDRTIGQAPTMPGAAWFHMITQELANVLTLEGADVTANKMQTDQVKTAIKKYVQNALTLLDLSAYAKLAKAQTFTAQQSFSVAPAYTGSALPATLNDGTLITALWAKTLFPLLTGINAISADNTFSGTNNFTKSLTAPTPLSTDNSTNVATTAWVIQKINEILSSVGGVPTGCVVPWMGDIESIPENYLYCNGSYYDKTEYAALYRVIGDKFGTSGSTFKIPQLNDGRFLEGYTTAGIFHDAGLPNIIGQISSERYGSTLGKTTGAFSSSGGRAYTKGGTDGSTLYLNADFDASKANSVYGNYSTVQPLSLTVIFIIKI